MKETKYVFFVWSVLSCFPCFLQHGRRMDMSEPGDTADRPPGEPRGL